ncbi:MAG: fructose 1,6-bisphosphatase [Candidatus Omnitrophota bacterium]
MRYINSMKAVLVGLGLSLFLLPPSEKAEARRVKGEGVLPIRTDFTVPEGQPKDFFTNDYQSYRIDGLLAKPLVQIPDAVIKAIRAKLEQDITRGRILSVLVNDFGGTDIDIHVTHKYGQLNAAVQRVLIEAIKVGLLEAQKLGLLKSGINITSMSLADLAKALRVKYGTHSITERGAEAVVMSKIIGAGIGAANIKLYHQFFITGSTPLQKLGYVPVVDLSKGEKLPVRGFRAIVRRTEDVLKGNLNGDAWQFEKSAELTIINKDGTRTFYPSKDESLQLLALASQPNDFLITHIYPVEGSTLTAEEPLVSVVYQAVYGEDGRLRTLNPTFINRSQSGADAVAGVAKIFYDVNFVPGGSNGEYFVATKPVTLEEARKAPPEGIAYVVVYGWQSKNGAIPKETGGVIDHVAANPPALEPERNLAYRLSSVMTTHKDEQPYLSAFAAQQRVAALRQRQAQLFIRAPKETDIDPIMDEVEAKVAGGELLSVTDDKADMGGKWGHNYPPEYMSAINRATIIEAIENGQLSDGNIIGFLDKGRLKRGTTMAVGDDSHILMIGDKSRNSAVGHQLSFTSFTRGYLFAVVNGEKPYGLGQDYQGKEAKQAKANPYFYSRLSERFFAILREVMPEDYLPGVEKMYAGWKEWQKRSATVQLPEPFSGNVSQQGIGTARYLVNIKGGERTFSVLAGDKMGPAALNRIIREGVDAALKAGEFKNGLVYEIWDAKAFDEHGNIPVDKIPQLFADVEDAIASLKEPEQAFVQGCYTAGKLRTDLPPADKTKLAELLKQAGYVPTERIFLDAQRDKEAIFLYLADSDRFNIKQVWAKKTAGWDINNFQAYLDRPVLGSSVTKLGILAGGEYIGKDDPVMVGNSALMEYIFAFLKNNPVIIQGDMNGSHWLAAIPTAFKYAVATKESHPILVGFRYTLSEDGKKLARVESVFDNAEYDSMRTKMFQFNLDFIKAQLGGQFEPYGTNWRTVEASYPLAKLLRALQEPDSPFLVRNKKPEEQSKGIMKAIIIMSKLLELFNVANSLPGSP